MTVIASLLTSLGLESSSFMTGLDEASKAMRATTKKFEKVGGDLQKIGAVMTVGLTAPFTAWAASSIDGALAQRQALAQVEAGLASMGPVAGRTAEQLARAADAFETTSLFDADVILTKVTANLLTFGNIAGAQFDRAQQAALDLAQRMGGDLQGAAILIGKALNDPVKGMTALGRAGVQLSEGQKAAVKEMVATGNVAGAQAVILGELEKQFKGSAAAAANTDPYRQMQVAFGQMSDVLGEAVLQIIPPLTSALKGIADVFLALPAPMQTTVIGVMAFGAAMGPVVAVAGTLVSGLGAVLPVLAALRVALISQAIPAIASFVVATAPISVPIIAATAAIAGIVYAIRNWDQIKPYVDKVVAWMGALYQGVKTWVLDRLSAVWDGVKAGIDRVKGWFFGLYDAVVGHSYIPDMVDEIGEHMARLQTELVAPARAATQSAEQAFQALGQRVGPLLDRLFPDQAKVNQFKADMAALVDYARQAGWSSAQLAEAQGRLRNEAAGLGVDYAPTVTIADPTEDIGLSVQETGEMVEDAWARVQAANDNTVESFANMARDVIGSLGNFGQALKRGDWLGALQNVADLVGQVSGLLNGSGGGGDGRTFSTNFGGFRAAGGPVMPNRSYVVGEQGPEILRMGGRGGTIVPNDQIGGAAVVQLVVGEGQMFEPRVTGIAGNVSVETVSGAARRSGLRGRQRYA